MTVAPGIEAPPSARTRLRISARLAVLLVSGISSLVLATVIALLPVPYVIFSPGPVRDTLGSVPGGDEDLIHIDGVETYETSGELKLTTISVTGGPLGELYLTDLVAAWLDPTRSVRPVETVYPSDRSADEAEQENAQEMLSAQQTAAVAALTQAGYDVPVQLTVLDVTEGAPAVGVVADGDVIEAVDGEPVVDSQALVDAVTAHAPGDVVRLTVSRQGTDSDVDVELTASEDGRTVIGVLIEPVFDLPFEVTYDVSGIGGPSAGLMFALGIFDKLTEGELTGGEDVAGTGTITETGVVGAIDGIQQKMVAARRSGADWFLAPESNCDDVSGAIPDGLRVVRVASLDEAVAALEAIAAGETSGLPGCS